MSHAHSTSTYTDADVQALVAAAQFAVPRISQSNRGTRQDLERALAPFQSDPDAEVIEAMARAQWESSDSAVCPWSDVSEYSKQNHRRAMRAALAAYRAHQEGSTK